MARSEETVIEIQRLDGGTLRIRHAAEMAQAFFRLDPSANGPNAFDAHVVTSPKDRIVEADVHAINATMAARSPLRHWQGLITKGPSPWLEALDPSWALLDMTDQEWESLGVESKLEKVFRAMFGPGRRLSVVTKVLHMKRPGLVPVCDRLVLEQLGAPVGLDTNPTWAASFVGHIHREGRRNRDGLRTVQKHLAQGGSTPSPLRILEALIWQSHPDVWYSGLASLVAGWLSEAPAEEPGAPR